MGKYKDTELYGDTVEWFYMSRDTHSGSFSTGYPCWDSSLVFAEMFFTAEEAEERFLRDKKYLDEELRKFDYDPSTLSIRKIQLKPVKRL